MTDIIEHESADLTEHPRARFKSFEESTAEDWAIITPQLNVTQSFVADRVIQLMRDLEIDHGGFPVNRLEHSLQTATRAERDGRDDEYVLCALLHDIGTRSARSTTRHRREHPEAVRVGGQPLHGQEPRAFQGYYFWHASASTRTPASSSATPRTSITPKSSARSTTRPRSMPTTRATRSSTTNR